MKQQVYLWGIVCSLSVPYVLKQHEIPNNSAFEISSLMTHFQHFICETEYIVDCLNSRVHPFETNDSPFGACLMTPNVISTFMRPRFQHMFSTVR